MSQKNYAILEDPYRSTRRASWSANNGIQYCGICMRGVIEAETGHRCSNCGSQVLQVLEVIQGGAPRKYRRRKDTEQRSTVEPFLKVVSL